jgi:hypothetical protein
MLILFSRIYPILALAWAIWATYKYVTMDRYKPRRTGTMIFVTFILNLLGMPIAVIIYLYGRATGADWLKEDSHARAHNIDAS